MSTVLCPKCREAFDSQAGLDAHVCALPDPTYRTASRPTARDAVRNLDPNARNTLDTLVNDLVDFQWSNPTVGPTDLAHFVLLALTDTNPTARTRTDEVDEFVLVRDGNGFTTRFVVEDVDERNDSPAYRAARTLTRLAEDTDGRAGVDTYLLRDAEQDLVEFSEAPYDEF